MNRQGCLDYFESVYHETFDRLSKFVFFKVACSADAEDIVASVYSDLYQYVVLKGKRPENILAYLIKMANHELSRHYVGNPHLVSFDDDYLGLPELVPDENDVELGFIEKFENDTLWKAVQQLSAAEQQVIIAKFRFDMTFKEISQNFNQSESTIKLRYYRSLKKLQKILE